MDTEIPRDATEDFLAECQRMGLPISEHQRGQFVLYHELLLQWNRKVNLMSRADESRVFSRHFLDALLLLPHLRMAPGSRVADLGTGAGLPGIPLKVLQPSLDLTLIESKRRKVLFLRHVVKTLALDACTVAHTRAEALAGDPRHAGRYGLLLARAVADVPLLCSLAAPLLAPGGLLVCYKGPDAVDSIACSSPYLAPYAFISSCTIGRRAKAFLAFVRIQ